MSHFDNKNPLPLTEAPQGHNLVPIPDKLYSLTDMDAEATYFALVDEWQASADAAHARPEQQPSITDDGLGLHFPRITLYHGGDTPEITAFLPAEDTTMGNGLYTTSMPDQAFGYAVVRADQRKKIGDTIVVDGLNPVVYEVEIADVSLIDLRTPEITEIVMQDFASYLEQWLTEQPEASALHYLMRMHHEIVEEKIMMIRGESENPWGLKGILQQTGKHFSDFVTGRGFDGVIGFEGGEGGYTGRHDTWVIMDPTKAMVTNEVLFLTPNVSDQDAWNAQRAKNADMFGDLPPPPVWANSNS